LKRQKIDWEWKENGDLTIWNILPAFIQHPVTHEEIWFNQVISNHCTYHQSHPMVGLILKDNQIFLTAEFASNLNR